MTENFLSGDNILTGICVARHCGIVDKRDTVLLAKIKEENGYRTLRFQPAHSGGLENNFSGDIVRNLCVIRKYFKQ